MNQDLSAEEMVSVPISIFRQGEDGKLDAETDRLTEAMMVSLRGDVLAATARAEVAEAAAEQARERSIQLNGEMVAARARIAGLETTKRELEAKLLAIAASETDARTLEHLGDLLVTEQDKCKSLAVRLAAAEGEAAKSAERGVQLAELTAQHRHASESVDAMTKELYQVRGDLSGALARLEALQLSERELKAELRRTTESLALADKARTNAVAAAEQRVRDQLAGAAAPVPAGMVLTPAKEIAYLREQAAQNELMQVRVSELTAELSEITGYVTEQADQVEQGIRDLEFANLELERYGCSIQEQALMIREQGRRLIYANTLIHLYHGRNNLPGFTREEGHVTLFSLHADCLAENGDDPIDKTKPLFWWTSRHGGGCLIALSLDLDERGRQVVVTPTLHFEHEGQLINITDVVAPPVSLRDEIADYMATMDRQTMLDTLTEAEMRANEVSFSAEPTLGRIDEAQKRLQARRKAIVVTQESLKRAREKALRLLAKKVKKAAKKGH
ncbi:coiled-coil domain-containing protein [Aeromonas hydrophila]|uniref:hypothetical protein n=1 Tax=Aeromonas hydrophila TaxID=644 RepID=UPI00080A9972|nr:hypothetical protein [Aeromonas hydrophila]ANT70205.1 hypothetical protein TK34_22275 [Aeromonas hydrophila]